MSITFAPASPDGKLLRHCACDPEGPADQLMTCPACKLSLDLSNANAIDLLAWLGLALNFVGQVPARELAARCRRRLWSEARNDDREITAEERLAEFEPLATGARLITMLRPAGYLRQRTAQLLAVAEAADDGLVCWS